MTQAEAYKIIENHYKNNFKQLVNRTIGKTGNRYNAEDTIQEAYTRALTYWKSFDPEVNTFESWFDGIINNSVRNTNSEARSKGMINPDYIDPPFLNQAYFKRFLTEIKNEVDQLPKDKSRILSLALFENYTPLDISRLTNKTVNAIRIILFRFREEIKLKYGSSLYGRS